MSQYTPGQQITVYPPPKRVEVALVTEDGDVVHV